MHRYRPNLKTGWTEHYIGFNGDFAKNLYRNIVLSSQGPVLKIGFKENLLQEFDDVFALISEGKPGYQQISAGKVIYILGEIISIVKNNEFAGKDIERKIRKACLHMRENFSVSLNMENLAAELNLGYSYFRRMFKNNTSLSPTQYHLQIKIKKAKKFIANNKKA